MRWRQRIDQIVDQQFDRLVALRRHLHAHPEPSGEELETSLHLYQFLAARGLDVRMGPEGRGVLVDSRDDPAIGRVALRGDIDALRIHDAKRARYRSTRDGVMHACGHDAHATCAAGAALALDQLAKDGVLPQPVAWRAVLQPAEETATGAAEMVQAGALDGVDAIFALHADPTLPTGMVGMRPGVLTAYAEMLRIEVRGSSGHAARPHESRDPIAAAAQLITTLYQFVPRVTDSQEAVVVSFGQVTGGDHANVIPEAVTLRGTLRTLDAEVRRRTLAHVHRLAQGVAEITGTQIEIHYEVHVPSVENDPRLTGLVADEAADLLGGANLRSIARSSMGSEDFSVYGEHVPLSMFRLGCVAEPPGPGLHTPEFDVDERCLAVGAKLLARAVVAASLATPPGESAKS